MTTTVPVRISSYPVPRHVVGAGFDIALHEGAARAARVVPGAMRVCVVVADGAMATAGSPMAFDLPVAGPLSSCQVWGHSDGAIQVRAAWSPPALLVSRERTVMVPETPGTPGVCVMAPGDRLLVLSSSAYEAAPEQMVRLLHEEPARLLAADADDLLNGLFRDVPEAGGAVVTRLG
ncbi:MAG: hypothetical protein ABJA74_08905 [Lapillicoccus sp.]